MLPVLSILFWIQAPSAIQLGHQAIVISEIPASIKILNTLTSLTKLYGFAVSPIPLTIKLLVLYFLIQLFRRYEQRNIFSIKNVNTIKSIGITLFIGQLINPIYQALLSFLLTWHNPVGERTVILGFSGSNLGILFTAMMIILISWIMREGYELQEDQEYTI